jgi:hypothetical protein
MVTPDKDFAQPVSENKVVQNQPEWAMVEVAHEKI